MSRVSISCIVEGHGDVAAVPILLRRMVSSIDQNTTLNLPFPIRVSRSKIIKPGELERFVTLAAHKNNGPGGILILLDADDDCPALLAPQLLYRARTARSDIPIAVVLAKREFESWFIASAASLRGKHGLSDTLEIHPEPENIRGAKEWLRQRMVGNSKYSETIDQPALTRLFDLTSARQTSSFDKLFRDVERILLELNQNTGTKS